MAPHSARTMELQGYGGVDGFTLKIIAITAMTIDHVGAVLYPEALWLRLIGRLAMPIFAFLLVEGYHHTASLPRYLLRLFIFALISQPIYRLAFPQGLNIFFDLTAGLGVLWAVDRLRPWLQAVLLLAVCTLAIVLRFDWWHLCILTIFIYHRTRGNFPRTAIAISALFVTNAIVFAVIGPLLENSWYMTINIIHLGCILVLPLLWLYNGRRGTDIRYFFYAWYPAHFLVLCGIKALWFASPAG